MDAAKPSIQKDYEMFVAKANRDANNRREEAALWILSAGNNYEITDEELAFDERINGMSAAELSVEISRIEAGLIELDETVRAQTIAGCRAMHGSGRK